jgi:hypothetical protein
MPYYDWMMACRQSYKIFFHVIYTSLSVVTSEHFCPSLIFVSIGTTAFLRKTIVCVTPVQALNEWSRASPWTWSAKANGR